MTREKFSFAEINIISYMELNLRERKTVFKDG